MPPSLSLQLLNVHVVVERLSSVGGICTTRLVGPNDLRLPSRRYGSAITIKPHQHFCEGLRSHAHPNFIYIA